MFVLVAYLFQSYNLFAESGAVVATPFSLRFTSLDFTSEFEDKNSGMFKKLSDQIHADVS